MGDAASAEYPLSPMSFPSPPIFRFPFPLRESLRSVGSFYLSGGLSPLGDRTEHGFLVCTCQLLLFPDIRDAYLGLPRLNILATKASLSSIIQNTVSSSRARSPCSKVSSFWSQSPPAPSYSPWSRMRKLRRADGGDLFVPCGPSCKR